MRYYTGHPASVAATKIRTRLYDALEVLHEEWKWSSEARKEEIAKAIEDAIHKINLDS